MPVSDPIGDMLTRIRNGSRAHQAQVVIPLSKLKQQIAEVLKSEGFVKDVHVHKTSAQGEMTVVLKYDREGEPAFSHVKRVSKPGLRRYVGYQDLPRVLNGLGASILSTPKGILVDREARKQKLGGELLCTIW
ncbi:MAG: 30S ribosomal protein S8 [Deltaproteobacteria bacterium]|nr:30S ribosomal protein S8 [Deltaproteobacteria bacterium]